MTRPEHPANPVRIAMWSGPRNLSTALMRSFEARGDCRVSDEPLYAFYLHETAIEHPMRAQVLASQPTDWRRVVAELLGPCEQPLWFQKQMAHHALPALGRDWMAQVRHAFLIRDPRQVLASYAAKREQVAPADLGYHQQVALLEHARALGQPALVLDSADLLADPPGTLRRLCEGLGIAYTDRMLRWPPGRRTSDGVWADHWYASVETSTGFGAPSPPTTTVAPHLQGVLDDVWPAWQALRAYAGPGQPPVARQP